jgi:High potential iron-sulfur protein
MNHRRRFIALVPFAGVTLLLACSKESAPGSSASTTPPPAPMPAPDPAPMAAPPSASASTANLPLLEESDPVAAGLGYVAVASRADGVKYKNFAAGQACGNCSLFGGQAGEAQGPCPIFAGKQVMATGWCSAYVKKAA